MSGTENSIPDMILKSLETTYGFKFDNHNKLGMRHFITRQPDFEYVQISFSSDNQMIILITGTRLNDEISVSRAANELNAAKDIMKKYNHWREESGHV